MTSNSQLIFLSSTERRLSQFSNNFQISKIYWTNYFEKMLKNAKLANPLDPLLDPMDPMDPMALLDPMAPTASGTWWRQWVHFIGPIGFQWIPMDSIGSKIIFCSFQMEPIIGSTGSTSLGQLYETFANINSTVAVILSPNFYGYFSLKFMVFMFFWTQFKEFLVQIELWRCKILL